MNILYRFVLNKGFGFVLQKGVLTMLHAIT